jgi:hypothetical protein
MAKKQNGSDPPGRSNRIEVTDYHHKQAKRKNNPLPKIAAEGPVEARQKTERLRIPENAKPVL